MGEEWDDLLLTAVLVRCEDLPVDVGRVGVTFPFNRSFFRLS